jgi:hypothetical protein
MPSNSAADFETDRTAVRVSHCSAKLFAYGATVGQAYHAAECATVPPAHGSAIARALCPALGPTVHTTHRAPHSSAVGQTISAAHRASFHPAEWGPDCSSFGAAVHAPIRAAEF